VSDSKADLFREMFFEEASELLVTLREGLAGLGAAGDDRALLDRVYRAAHSLKGAAAMVGFAAISEHALGLERALGQFRTGGGAVGPELAQSLEIDRQGLAASVEGEEAKFRASSH
jgi:two-component system, chemotaxis family, sensor kinase CheA